VENFPAYYGTRKLTTMFTRARHWPVPRARLILNGTIFWDITPCSPLSLNLRFGGTTWRYIPEDGTLHNHRCENLKSYRLILFMGSPTISSTFTILPIYALVVKVVSPLQVFRPKLYMHFLRITNASCISYSSV
jgi:hypothetical protein